MKTIQTSRIATNQIRNTNRILSNLNPFTKVLATIKIQNKQLPILVAIICNQFSFIQNVRSMVEKEVYLMFLMLDIILRKENSNQPRCHELIEL